METLYVLQIPNSEYIELIQDIARMLILQLTIQFLYYINGESFFTADFILLCVYIVLGVSLYWLVFRKLVTITGNNISEPTK